jgi:hypothetical protein
MAQPSQVWPVSIAGWVALIIAIFSLVVIIFGWGKFFGKIQDIVKLVAELVKLVDAISERVVITEHTLWGPKGDNGLASEFRQIKKRVDLIQERNTRVDAVRARAEGAEEVGHESRLHTRRYEDKIIRGENE